MKNQNLYNELVNAVNNASENKNIMLLALKDWTPRFDEYYKLVSMERESIHNYFDNQFLLDMDAETVETLNKINDGTLKVESFNELKNGQILKTNAYYWLSEIRHQVVDKLYKSQFGKDADYREWINAVDPYFSQFKSKEGLTLSDIHDILVKGEKIEDYIEIEGSEHKHYISNKLVKLFGGDYWNYRENL